MTRDDITRMAREALILPAQEKDDNGTGMWATFTVYKGSIEALEKFAALVAAAEREACAQVCDEIANRPSNMVLGVALDCAAAIRARGKK